MDFPHFPAQAEKAPGAREASSAEPRGQSPQVTPTPGDVLQELVGRKRSAHVNNTQRGPRDCRLPTVSSGGQVEMRPCGAVRGHRPAVSCRAPCQQDEA